MTRRLYVSYLIRFWQEDYNEQHQTEWCGEVESVQSGQKERFCDLAAVLRFFQAELESFTTDLSEKDRGS